MTTTNDTLTPDLTSYLTVHRCLRAAALARYWKGYAGEVLAHHTIEDVIFFPALVERVPVAAELIGRTDKDHDHLDHLMEEIGQAMAALAAGDDAGRVTPLLADLAEHMDAHLGFEDEDVLPLFERHFTAAEYAALDEQALKHLGLGKQAAFTVPFVMHWVDDARRGHARLTEAALGDLARPEAG